ncbi:DNA topoisomerase 1-like protein, partial [Trifolium pratense]
DIVTEAGQDRDSDGSNHDLAFEVLNSLKSHIGYEMPEHGFISRGNPHLTSRFCRDELGPTPNSKMVSKTPPSPLSGHPPSPIVLGVRVFVKGPTSDMRWPEHEFIKDPLHLVETEVSQHHTQPPPRYSESSLVKKLEELGIGRPSTYASTLRVLQDRNYVTVKSRVLSPEFRGRMVSAFLSHHFSEVTDYSFTADMETELDNVSAGLTKWKGLLGDYWTRFKSYCERTSNVHIHQVWLLSSLLKACHFVGVSNYVFLHSSHCFQCTLYVCKCCSDYDSLEAKCAAYFFILSTHE